MIIKRDKDTGLLVGEWNRSELDKIILPYFEGFNKKISDIATRVQKLISENKKLSEEIKLFDEKYTNLSIYANDKEIEMLLKSLREGIEIKMIEND